MRIITDSTADIDVEEAKKFNITVVPLKIIFDGKEYLDRVTLNTDKFYELLENSETLPTTSQPSPQDFLNAYQEGIKNNEDILVLTISSKVSGTYQSAHIAKDLAEYDNIHIIDSTTATLGFKILVLKAIALRDQGMSFQDMITYLEEYKNRIQIRALVDTLEYFYKGGRLSKTAAVAGTLLKLKPIVGLKDGVVDVFDKARGQSKGVAKIIDLVHESGEIDLDEPIFIGYTGNNNGLDKFEAALKEEFHFENPYYGCVGPVVGTHAGPGARAIVYVTKK